MENIVGGNCFGHLHPEPPPSTQARALVCWVAQVFSLRLPPASSPFPFENPAIHRLFFPLTVPRRHSASPFYCFFSSGSAYCFSFPASVRKGEHAQFAGSLGVWLQLKERRAKKKDATENEAKSILYTQCPSLLFFKKRLRLLLRHFGVSSHTQPTPPSQRCTSSPLGLL